LRFSSRVSKLWSFVATFCIAVSVMNGMGSLLEGRVRGASGEFQTSALEMNGHCQRIAGVVDEDLFFSS